MRAHAWNAGGVRVYRQRLETRHTGRGTGKAGPSCSAGIVEAPSKPERLALAGVCVIVFLMAI